MSERIKAVLLVTLLCASAWADEANWSVTLTDLGDQKISVIKIVREQTGLGLKDAKESVGRDLARKMATDLTDAGARVTLTPKKP